jgi:hypothetical protein
VSDARSGAGHSFRKTASALLALLNVDLQGRLPLRLSAASSGIVHT